MKISSHFEIFEFVPKELYTQFANKSIWFIDPRIVDIAEVVRQRFNKPVTINNWHSGGSYNNRGYRLPDCTTGGKLSQHKRGCAVDLSIAGVSVENIYDDITKNFDLYRKVGLTTVEDIAFTTGAKANDELGWIHADVRNTGMDALLIVKP